MIRFFYNRYKEILSKFEILNIVSSMAFCETSCCSVKKQTSSDLEENCRVDSLWVSGSFRLRWIDCRNNAFDQTRFIRYRHALQIFGNILRCYNNNFHFSFILSVLQHLLRISLTTHLPQFSLHSHLTFSLTMHLY